MENKKCQFTMDIWDKAGQLINDLPEKPKSERKVPIKDGINRIKNAIKKAKNMGYTHEEILAVLDKVGIKISKTSFKTYIEKKTNHGKIKTTTSTNIDKNKAGIEKKKKVSTKNDFNDNDTV